MINWLRPYFQFEMQKDFINYRQRVTEIFILVFAFCMLAFYTSIYFYNGNAPLFYTDGVLLMLFPLIVYLFRDKKRIIAHIALALMGLTLLYIVHINKGHHYLPIWSFVYIYICMIMYGYQRGILISSVYFFAIFSLLFTWIGSSLNIVAYIRFTSVAILSVFIAFISEYLIAKTIKKLTTIQKMLENTTKTDSLTNLYNRRHFDDCFPKDINTAKRNNKLLALAMFDIDFFKNYNDTYGHQAGDQALIRISELLRGELHRSNDAVFRLGGEEFCLLFQVKGQQSAIDIIERIQISIEGLKIKHSGSEVSRYLTLSCGLLIIRPEDNIIDQQAYKDCDDLLYKAKHAGRNQMLHYISPEPVNVERLIRAG
ncbi:MAG: GGDEF domain-containing protein [Psychromonas sp.]